MSRDDKFDASEDELAELAERLAPHIEEHLGEPPTESRRSVLKASGLLGTGLALGLGGTAGTRRARASSGPPTIGSSSNRVDLFADTVDSNTIVAGTLDVDDPSVGSTPTKRPLVSNGPKSVDLGSLPTDGTNADFNEALAKEVPLILRHGLDLNVPTDDSLKNIDVKLPPIWRQENATAGTENAAANLNGDEAAPSNHKVGPVYVKGGAGWSWAVLGVEIQSENPFDNESVGVAVYHTQHATVRNVNWVGGTNGLLAYASNVEASQLDFGSSLTGSGMIVKHGGHIWEQKANSTPTQGNVGAHAYRPETGRIDFLRESSTLTGDTGFVKSGSDMTGLVWASDKELFYHDTGSATEVTASHGFRMPNNRDLANLADERNRVLQRVISGLADGGTEKLLDVDEDRGLCVVSVAGGPQNGIFQLGVDEVLAVSTTGIFGTSSGTSGVNVYWNSSGYFEIENNSGSSKDFTVTLVR